MTELARRLFVYGLPEKKRKDELWALFAKFGRVTDVHNSGQGYGFVTFEIKDEAAVAMMKMNRTKIGGRTITVNIARPRNSGGRFDGHPNGGDWGGWGGDGSLERREGEQERKCRTSWFWRSW